jgi:hypothetical protein
MLQARRSAVGPSRHFAATQQFGRFRNEVDIRPAALRLSDLSVRAPVRLAFSGRMAAHAHAPFGPRPEGPSAARSSRRTATNLIEGRPLARQWPSLRPMLRDACCHCCGGRLLGMRAEQQEKPAYARAFRISSTSSRRTAILPSQEGYREVRFGELSWPRRRYFEPAQSRKICSWASLKYSIFRLLLRCDKCRQNSVVLVRV